MKPQRLALLGSTGSIGQSTLDVVARHPEQFQVFALAAHRQADRLFDQIRQFQPKYAVLVDASAASELKQQVSAAGLRTEVLVGEIALGEVAAAPEVDTVLSAVVGAAGLAPTLAAVEAGKRVLLANKESLVLAGGLFIDAVRRSGSTLLPIDSEHNAIFQCWPAAGGGQSPHGAVRKIILTASGGPFRTREVASLHSVTPDEACAHPNWSMGRKISVDSATMMNKGLEVIEAHWLFDLPSERIEVLIHPQSIVHSMVEYIDGSVLAQLGNPDMRTPIAHALAWPGRVESGVSSLELARHGRLDFEQPDLARFPALALAYRALEAGGSAAAYLNAANEVAVAAFLEGKIGFMAIASLVSEVMDRLPNRTVNSISEATAADADARRIALELIQRR